MNNNWAKLESLENTSKWVNSYGWVILVEGKGDGQQWTLFAPEKDFKVQVDSKKVTSTSKGIAPCHRWANRSIRELVLPKSPKGDHWEKISSGFYKRFDGFHLQCLSGLFDHWTLSNLEIGVEHVKSPSKNLKPPFLWANKEILSFYFKKYKVK